MSIHKVLDKQGLDFLVDLVDTAGEACLFALHRSASALTHECVWPYQAHG